MARDDWFRNTTWNDEIAARFERHLGRARDKSQRLRIQASYLTRQYPKVALSLLERFFALGGSAFAAQAHVERGYAFATLGDIAGALSSYEDALESERLQPNVKTQAYLEFPCLILNSGKVALYVRALEVLDNHRNRPTFPVEHFRYHGARALLLHHIGRTREARTEAALAMAASQAKQSGFHNHQSLGLVRNTDDEFSRQIAALAN